MTKKLMLYFALLAIILILSLAFAAILIFSNLGKVNGTKEPAKESESTPAQNNNSMELYPPISGALSRITKKPFGLYVEKGNSTVSPERFTGYHTAVDFETYKDEKGKEVPVFAVCTGKILKKEIISGYGGLIIQECEIDKAPVTVLYGHVDIGDKSSANMGKLVRKSERIAKLGEQGFYTDNERKHLHLGIHKGEKIEYLGYVLELKRLNEWIDIEKYLRQT